MPHRKIIHHKCDFCYITCMNKNPKHLLFDADGTLYDFKATEDAALSTLFSNLSLPYTDEFIDIYHGANSGCWKEYEEGVLSMDRLRSERFRRFFGLIGKNDDPVEAGEEYIRLLGEAGIMLPGAVGFLEEIHGLYPMYIITNGIADTQHMRFRGTDTEKYFDGIYISEELGVQKPDPGFFRKVLDDIGIEKENAIVIGDSERSDIQGAVNAGIENIFISFDGKCSEMADHNVSSYEDLISLLHDIA